jgi:hypothetical protein
MVVPRRGGEEDGAEGDRHEDQGDLAEGGEVGAGCSESTQPAGLPYAV